MKSNHLPHAICHAFYAVSGAEKAWELEDVKDREGVPDVSTIQNDSDLRMPLSDASRHPMLQLCIIFSSFLSIS